MSDDTKISPLFFSVRDIFLWRGNKLSALVISTATWVLLDVYKFNFVTVVSWATMFIITSLYINLVRLFGKEAPKLPEMEISEDTSMETANTVRKMVEGRLAWMMHVSAQREWFTFVRAVAALWLLAYVASVFDFLTLSYIGIVGGMSIPVIYEKQEGRIKKMDDRMRIEASRFYQNLDQKVFKQVINKVSNVKHKSIVTKEADKEKTG